MASETPRTKTAAELFQPGLGGGTCAQCGFTYFAHRGHLIPCPVCALQRADALLQRWLDSRGIGYDALVEDTKKALRHD